MATNETKRVPIINTHDRGADGLLVIEVAGVGTLTLDPKALPPANRAYAEWHGLKQKIVDTAALERNKDTGASATPQEKFDAMRDQVEHLLAGGDWNRRPTGGSGNAGLLVEALVRVSGQSVDEVRAFVATMDDKTQSAMRGDTAIAPVIAEIKAERARKAGSVVAVPDWRAALKVGAHSPVAKATDKKAAK